MARFSSIFLKSHCNGNEIVWTGNAQRIAVLLMHALRFNEPVLLVGETGIGKTRIIQEVAELLKRKLMIINCHLNTETSDFLGGLRPAREKDKALFEWVDGPLIEAMNNGHFLLGINFILVLNIWETRVSQKIYNLENTTFY